MSSLGGLKTIFQHCLEPGGFGPITVLAPYDYELQCALTVREVCYRREQPFIMIRADGTNEQGFVSHLHQELTGQHGEVESDLVYQEAVGLLKRHSHGTLCVVLTRPMQLTLRRLLSRLVFLVQRNKLHWRFVVIDSDSKDLNAISTTFNTEHNIRWSAMSRTWSIPTFVAMPSRHFSK